MLLSAEFFTALSTSPTVTSWSFPAGSVVDIPTRLQIAPWALLPLNTPCSQAPSGKELFGKDCFMQVCENHEGKDTVEKPVLELPEVCW